MEKVKYFFEKTDINGQVRIGTDFYKRFTQKMNWIALSSERLDVIRDDCGVPLEWTLLKIGSNPICQEGIDGAINLSAENMQQIISYHRKKGGRYSAGFGALLV